jgi:hypothetical protein
MASACEELFLSWLKKYQQGEGLAVKCRNIAISRIDPISGEQKAHTCDIGLLESSVLIPGMSVSAIPFSRVPKS